MNDAAVFPTRRQANELREIRGTSSTTAAGVAAATLRALERAACALTCVVRCSSCPVVSPAQRCASAGRDHKRRERAVLSCGGVEEAHESGRACTKRPARVKGSGLGTHRTLRVWSRRPVADGHERTPGVHPARSGATAHQRHHLGRVRDGAQALLAFLVGHSLVVLRRRATAAQLVNPGTAECG